MTQDIALRALIRATTRLRDAHLKYYEAKLSKIKEDDSYMEREIAINEVLAAVGHLAEVSSS